MPLSTLDARKVKQGRLLCLNGLYFFYQIYLKYEAKGLKN